MSKKYSLLVDLRKCVGCTSCQVSCKMENAVPVGSFRSKVDFADSGEFPKAKRHFFPKSCNQCDDPPCVDACPVPGATTKREDGVITVNRDVCIGCSRCAEACPYGARFMHAHLPVKNNPANYTKQCPEVRGKKSAELRVADKCDYCSHRLAAGIEEPACVRNCAGKARYFGDLNDPTSEISKIKAYSKAVYWHPEFGTKPRNPYIAKDKEVFETADGEING